MKGTDNNQGKPGQDALETLFQNATLRERPSEADERAVRQALHTQWREQTAQHKARRRAMSLAAAASLALAMLIAYSLGNSPGAPAPVRQLATIEKLSGMVRIRSSSSGQVRVLDATSVLDSSHTILSGPGGRIAIRWLNGESIRIDQNSELKLASAAELELLAGRVYLDTDDSTPAAELGIRTPAGLVRHLGTRYMTRVDAGGVEVSVRDGKIQMNTIGGETIAGEGQRLSVSAHGGLSIEPTQVFGPEWRWVEEITPQFSSDGRSMTDLIHWAAHESGLGVAFASPAAEKLANETLLRGQVDMEPIRALNVMLQTSDLESEINAGIIHVSLQRED
jgi:ferric-dicitrate binding protein FerR (iron transport regulator)